MNRTYERGIETQIEIIDLSNGQLPNNANINDLFYVRRGGTIDGVIYPDNSILISKSNTNYTVSPSDFEFYYEPTPLNEVIVNSVYDLPEATDTGDGLGVAYHLEDDITYTISAQLVLSHPIVLGSTTIRGSWHGSQIVYVGTGALFRNNINSPIGAAAWIRDILLIGTTANTLLDVAYGGFLGLEFVYMQDFILGTAANLASFYIWDSTMVNPRGKLTVDSVSLSYWHALLADITVSLGGDALFHCIGNGATFDVTNLSVTPQAGDSVFYIDPAYTGRSILTDSRLNGGLGNLFKTGSLTQASPQISLHTFPGGSPDSQTIGSLYTVNNTATTTFDVLGRNVSYTSVSDAGGGYITLTSVGHGISNGDIAYILDDNELYDGGYTVSGVTLDTFNVQVVFTSNSTGVAELGWKKVLATTIAGENERAEMDGDNKIKFNNLEIKSVSNYAKLNPKAESGAAIRDYEFAIMKNNKRLVEAIEPRDMANKVGTAFILSTTTVIENDYFEIFARNLTDTTSMVMQNMNFIIK